MKEVVKIPNRTHKVAKSRRNLLLLLFLQNSKQHTGKIFFYEFTREKEDPNFSCSNNWIIYDDLRAEYLDRTIWFRS